MVSKIIHTLSNKSGLKVKSTDQSRIGYKNVRQFDRLKWVITQSNKSPIKAVFLKVSWTKGRGFVG